MEQRRLGTSGFTVPLLGLGTNNFGGRSDEAASLKVIDASIDIGANFFDTANIYTGTKSETIIGKALKGRRDKVILTTKFGLSMGAGPNMQGGSRGHILSELDTSLRRLQTDYLDLYQMHMVDRSTPIEETLRTLDDLVRAGKVRYIGCSNYDAWHLVEALHTSRALNLNAFVSVQPYYNLLKRGIERELAPCLRGLRHWDHSLLPVGVGLPHRQVPSRRGRALWDTVRQDPDVPGEVERGQLRDPERVGVVRRRARPHRRGTGDGMAGGKATGVQRHFGRVDAGAGAGERQGP